MRRFLTALVVVCTLTTLVGGAASASGTGTDRTFHGATSGRGVASGTITQFSPHGISFDGSGFTTHLGRTAIQMNACWGPGCSDPLSYQGVGQLTAANGDKLYASIIWGFDGSLAITITGGSGRFQGATGSATGTIVSDPPTGCCTRHAVMTFAGTISTSGSGS